VFTAGHIITGTGGHATERPVRLARSRLCLGTERRRRLAAVRETFKKGASVIKVASHFAPDEIQAQ
jgi:hypothetical protein